MALPSVFEQKTVDELLVRLDKLTFDTKPLWGKMNASQMLAHVNVAYDLAFGRTEPAKTNFVMRFIVKNFIKNMIVNEKPYGKNSPTSPVFIVSDDKNFDKEKQKLIEDIKITKDKGASFFEGKENKSFGVMTAIEWNNMFYKHLDHHFKQFSI